MKNSGVITFLAFLSLSHFSTVFFAQKSDDLLVGEAFYTWRDQKWNLLDTSIYSYNEQNQKISLLHHRWDQKKAKFTKYFKHEYTYNAAGKQTLDEIHKFEKRKYVYYDKYECLYDAKNNKTAEMGLTGEEFVNHHKSSYAYDQNNNVISKLIQELRFDTYENGALFTYTYTGENKVSTELQQFWNGSEYGNYSRYIYTYNPDNTLAEMLHQRWDETENDGYDDYEKIIFTYDSNRNLLSRLTQKKNSKSGAYENRQEDVYTYDQAGNRTSYLWRSWFENTATSINLFKYYYSPKK